jgi:hypothetical protein
MFFFLQNVVVMRMAVLLTPLAIQVEAGQLQGADEEKN